MTSLDTNVIFEAIKPDPNPAVKEWLNNQAVETLYLPTIVLAELLFGVAALPTGKRKSKNLSSAYACSVAMAIANEMMVATRDVQPFEVAGVRVINPWMVG